MSSTSLIVNALSMAESCLASSPTLFPTKNQYSFHLPPSKPIKLLHLSSSTSTSFSSWISLRHNYSPFRIVPLVAQTSDWAQQEEEGETENTEVFTWESQGEEGAEAGLDTMTTSEDDDGLIGGVDDGGDNAEEAGLEISEGGFYPEPPEDAKLFVGNLPYDVDSERLAQIFNEAGVVEIAEVIYNRETDQSRGFGFITMSTVEEADKAAEMFNRYDINGRLLTVNKAAPRGSPPQRIAREPSFRIYVGNLAWQVDDARLEQVFSEHGKVINARVVCDRETGRSRGFGFVTMSNETELNDAIAALDGQSLDGRSIRVNIAEERPRRSSF